MLNTYRLAIFSKKPLLDLHPRTKTSLRSPPCWICVIHICHVEQLVLHKPWFEPFTMTPSLKNLVFKFSSHFYI